MFIVIYILCFKWLVSQKGSVCVCVCVCVCVLNTLSALEHFFSCIFCYIVKGFNCNIYWMFYVSDEPEGKFLLAERIKLYCKTKFMPCIINNVTEWPAAPGPQWL